MKPEHEVESSCQAASQILANDTDKDVAERDPVIHTINLSQDA